MGFNRRKMDDQRRDGRPLLPTLGQSYVSEIGTAADLSCPQGGCLVAPAP
jgi:hypothetical protein